LNQTRYFIHVKVNKKMHISYFCML